MDVLDFDGNLALTISLCPFGFNLTEKFTDSSWNDSLFFDCLLICGRLSIYLGNYDIVGALWCIFVALHRVGFAATRLTIDEDCGMETDQNLFDKEICPCSPENTLLRATFVKDLVKFVTFSMTLFVHDPAKQILNIKLE